MIRSVSLLSAPVWVAALAATSLSSVGVAHAGSGTVVLKAGTIELVERGEELTGGASIVVRDGRILAVGKNLDIPPGAQVIDYGADAVIVPGLVSASSYYGVGMPSRRTADPLTRAVDNFDTYSDSYLVDLMGGVTTAYFAPTMGRLIGGQGAVIKLAGDESGRVLRDSASIDGTITAQARSVPGYWDPPVPATIDVGLGVVEQQLPGSAMGAGIALHELIGFARGNAKDTGAYGPETVGALRDLMQANLPWRMGAETEQEIRVLLELAKSEHLPLVIAGGASSGKVASDIAAAGAAVVVQVSAHAEGDAIDYGKGENAVWPTYDNAVRLVGAGVRTAIAPGLGMRVRDLRFAAGLASRGGLSPQAALRAITLGAAEILGVEGRVGSIAPGKDADFCVLTGAPISSGASVIATWVDGKVAWQVGMRSVEGAETDSEGKHAPKRVANTVVIEADELYVGDGRVLRPGQVLVHKGRIAEVGERVAHPSGAVVVHGPAAMPGIIDTLGFLGLEGSGRVPAPDFKLARIIEPGDDTDRRVARAGVTTVVLSPRGSSGNGAPMMAYKPAANDFASMVIADPAALRLQWTDRNRLESGKNLTQLLEKARDYDKKWREYDEAIAKWVPPPPEAEKTDAEKKDGDKASGDKKEEGDKKDESSGDKKDEKSSDSKDKKDKKKDKEDETDPVSGIWLAKVTVPPFAESARLRLRLELKGEEVTGSVRCDQVSVTLVELTGTWKEKKVDVSGLGTRGTVRIDGEAKDGKLDARLTLGKSEIKFQAERETKELPVAGRTEVRREKAEEKKEPKGKPKQPNTDEKLEPFRRAMRGDAAIVVGVDREDEILACVDAFAKVGIKPVLFGAEDAWRIADKIASRISGVLLSQQVLDVEQGKGLADERNRYEELAAAGIPVAFYSQAEEGAAELATMAAYAVALGLSPEVALRALTSDAAHIMAIDERVGRLAVGLDGDVLLLDGAPLEPATSVLRAWVNGEEIR